MAIPKIIHYCWFGRNPKPKLAEKCFESWKKFCPDYEIREWNEDNYDISQAPRYVRQAYQAKKWAFVTDFVRLQVVYLYGGIYLDTDVELISSLDPLLENQAYFGFEGINTVNTGLGFGAGRGCPILEELMGQYADIPFQREDGSFDVTPCPQRNTRVFENRGLVLNGERQQLPGEILILPMECLCPIDPADNRMHKTENTVSIHWFAGSWYSREDKKARRKDIWYNRTHWITRIPNRVGTWILGKERYESARDRLKGK